MDLFCYYPFEDQHHERNVKLFGFHIYILCKLSSQKTSTLVLQIALEFALLGLNLTCIKPIKKDNHFWKYSYIGINTDLFNFFRSYIFHYNLTLSGRPFWKPEICLFLIQNVCSEKYFFLTMTLEM